MPRFFIDPSNIGATHIQLDQETLAHIRVLRLGPTEPFLVSDGAGQDYRCILTGDTAEIVDKFDNRAEPRLRCTVYLAYTRGERLEYAIQKSVELGAAAIRLFPAQRCVARYDAKSLPKKLARFEKIALEAAKQSGRGIVPPMAALPDTNTALTEAATADCPLFCYELEAKNSLRTALEQTSNPKTASLVIGPEGGFTKPEATLAQGAGLRPITLGPRILRAETAPVAALAAVLFWAGEM